MNNVIKLRAHIDAGLPACTCDGSGYSLDGAPGPDGQPTARKCRGCASARVARQFGGAATWQRWIPRPELAAAVATLKHFPQTWASERKWACLLHALPNQANFGTGKTHACQAVAHDFVSMGLDAQYALVTDHLDVLRTSFDDHTVRAANLEKFDGLVILDDLGLEKKTDWAHEQIEQIENSRYQHRLPTLIASNLDKRSLEARYPRLVDRCHEGFVIGWAAPSWRRR